jgi:glucose/arabinose dehydrogenase
MKVCFALVAAMVSGIVLFSQNGISIRKWIGGVSIPVDITNCGDDRVFIIEKTGKIRIVENDKLLAEPFLDIVSKVRSSGNEQGLLGLTFHPNYSTNGYFYVNYTNRSNPTLTVIERYQVSANKYKADSLSGQILMTYVQPYANHNGGCLKFGKDGYLYIGAGDGGSANDPQNNGQNRKAMLGKILRIDVDTSSGYKIPSTNPFIRDTNYLKEIWALGMRNPWRFSFDKLTGDLWIGDVGQDTWEEIDFEQANSKGGRNYGWRCYEGNHDFNLSGCNPKSTFTFPLHEYLSDENTNGCSVTGGYVYRGDKYPSLYGKYIYCDYCSGKFWILNRINDSSYTNVLAYDYANNSVTTFGEDNNGNLYFADAVTSSIYKIADTCQFSFKVVTNDPSCFGGSDGSAKTDLNNVLGAKFNWSNGDTVAEVHNLSPGMYSIKVLYNQCLAESKFEIHSRQQDSACISMPAVTEICALDSALLMACDRKNVMGYLWYKDSILQSRLQSRQVWVNESGNYQLALLDSAGCVSSFSSAIKIIVHPLPDRPQLSLQKDTLFATPGYAGYRWFLNGLFLGASTINNWIALTSGEYTVEGIDSNQCHSALSLPVQYIPVNTINAETTSSFFTLQPNPVHDILIIESRQRRTIHNLKYRIVNRDNKEVRNSILSDFKDSVKMNVSELIPGVYWITIQQNNQFEKHSFLKI